MKEIALPDQNLSATGKRRPETGETEERTGGFATGPWRNGDKPETGEQPEELLRFLDAEISLRRARKTAPARNRALFLVSGLLFIIAAAAAALLCLEDMLSDSVREGRKNSQLQTGSDRNF